MRRGKREEQEFLDSIDRLIAGEEVSLDEGADEGLIKGVDEGLRSAVEFSRRLSDFYPGPTAEFQEQLKSRLLLKLTEQEVAARQRAGTGRFWEFLDRLVPQSPVWRTAAVTLVMVVAVVTVMWRTGMFTHAPAGEAETAKGMLTAEAVTKEEEGMTVAGRMVESEAAAPKAAMEEEAVAAPSPEIALGALPMLLQVTPAEPVVAGYGDEVNFEVVFRNTSAETIEVTPFPPRFSIVGGGALRPVRIVPEGDVTVGLGDFESIEYRLTWDQRDDAGEQVAPGWYTMYVGSMTVTRGEELVEVEVPVGWQVLVQYPQGAMEKSLAVNQSLTVSEVTVTLERVELSALEAVVYAAVSPGYGAPEEGGPGLPTPGVPVRVTAWYTVDAGPAREALDPGERFFEDEDRTRLSWTHLDPLPSDARTLTFTIARIGEWEGPWEFHVSLQD